MTVGVTGVIWMPRGATVNSTSLAAGAGPAPLAVASPAWAAVAAGFADAGATLTGVMAELRLGWEGQAADAALAALAPFEAWTQQVSALAADTSTKAAVQSGAYSTAALTMPSLAEIASAQAAKVAAYSTGGAVAGGAAAAEAAEKALDVRAGLVMDTYEAASTIVATPASFDQPPAVTNRAEAGSEERPVDDVPSGTREPGFPSGGDAVRAATAAVLSAVHNPAIGAATAQIGHLAGATAPTVAAAATSAGGAVISAVGRGFPSMLDGDSVTAPSAYGGRADTVGGVATGSGPGPGGDPPPGSTAVRAARLSDLPDGPRASGAGPLAGVGPLGAAGRPVGSNGSTGRAPGAQGTGAQGTGATPALGQPAGLGGGAVAGASGSVGPTPGNPVTAPAGVAHATTSARGIASEDENGWHSTPGYLRHFEHFTDGRTVIPAVIGAEPDPWEGAR